MTDTKKRSWMMPVAAAALSAGVTTLLLSQTVLAEDRDTVRQLTLFANAYDSITARYVDDVDDKELIEAAIQGMLESLDPHSGFFSVDEFEEFTDDLEGTFGGIGIQITMEDGVVLVIAPIDGTPGFEAGLKPQDLITNINGEPVLGKSLEEAVRQMRGEIGTEVTLTILRRSTDEVFDVTVKRGVIPEQSVRGFTLEDSIAYLDLFQFTETTVENLHREMARLHEEAEAEDGTPLVGYILDLRGNPGGVLSAAIGVSDTFMDQGEIVSTRGREARDNRSIFARAETLAKDLPVVVLTNAGSASASEIVAGALQDHGRATLIGTRSFGKGSVQSLVPLAENTGMRLTTALYYTPSGRSIQAVGVEPDIEIAFDEAEARDLAGNVIREDYYENEITLEENADGPVEGQSVDASAALEAAELAASVSTEDDIVDVQLRAAVGFIKDLAGQEFDATLALKVNGERPEDDEETTEGFETDEIGETRPLTEEELQELSDEDEEAPANE